MMQRFWGTTDHAHFLSGNIGKYFKGTKLIFGNREHENLENCFDGTRKQGQLFFREHGTSWVGLFSGVALHVSRQCLISYYIYSHFFWVSGSVRHCVFCCFFFSFFFFFFCFLFVCFFLPTMMRLSPLIRERKKVKLRYLRTLHIDLPAIHQMTDHNSSKSYCRPRWLSWMRRPTGDQEVAGSTPRRGQQHSFVEIDHEIFSTVILSLPLIQEGQLPVSGERMCTILVNRLED